MLKRIARSAGIAGSLAALACAYVAPPPAVDQEFLSPPPGPLRRLAVMPFQPLPGLASPIIDREAAPSEVTALVARFVSEALQEAGFDVVPPDDLVHAFETESGAAPRTDAHAAAALAAGHFGADAVLLGVVSRYRERSGGAIGSTSPASVFFRVTLYSAPDARPLWSARFHETQQPLTENVLRTPFYPGGGTRWLTAAELARWGAGETARALTELPYASRRQAGAQ
ncbi:MAG: hypothetical protein O7G30_12115 [Proteobacteria bacterium]|nr:hypothetical protein [Pseudomonadota bacterium]